MPAARPTSLCFHGAGKREDRGDEHDRRLDAVAAGLDRHREAVRRAARSPCPSPRRSGSNSVTSARRDRAPARWSTARRTSAAPTASARGRTARACSTRNRTKNRSTRRFYRGAAEAVRPARQPSAASAEPDPQRNVPSSASRAQRRIAREVAPDAVGDRLREALLVAVAAQLQLLVGIRDERRLDQDRRNVGRLQHREAGLLDGRLVQRVDRRRCRRARGGPTFRLSLICARLRQVEQRAREHRIARVEIDAADQVGRVLLLREPARGGARRAAARTARTPTSRARAARGTRRRGSRRRDRPARAAPSARARASGTK